MDAYLRLSVHKIVRFFTLMLFTVYYKLIEALYHYLTKRRVE